MYLGAVFISNNGVLNMAKLIHMVNIMKTIKDTTLLPRETYLSCSCISS